MPQFVFFFSGVGQNILPEAPHGREGASILTVQGCGPCQGY